MTTRSNICYGCEETVYDMDVCCYECCRSYCYDCGKGYDPISRTCLLYAHANVYVKPSFTVGQLKQYEKDIPHLVKPECLTEYMAEYMDFLKEVIKSFNNKKGFKGFKELDGLEEEHNDIFKRFLSPDDYTQDLDFKCYTCKFPPVKQLFVIESDTQFYVNIQAVIHALSDTKILSGIKMLSGIKILVYDLVETEYKFVINDKKFYSVYPDKIYEHLYDDVIQEFRTYIMHQNEENNG